MYLDLPNPIKHKHEAITAIKVGIRFKHIAKVQALCYRNTVRSGGVHACVPCTLRFCSRDWEMTEWTRWRCLANSVRHELLFPSNYRRRSGRLKSVSRTVLSTGGIVSAILSPRLWFNDTDRVLRSVPGCSAGTQHAPAAEASVCELQIEALPDNAHSNVQLQAITRQLIKNCRRSTLSSNRTTRKNNLLAQNYRHKTFILHGLYNCKLTLCSHFPIQVWKSLILVIKVSNLYLPIYITLLKLLCN